jgi:DNA polymerase II large subunit
VKKCAQATLTSNFAERFDEQYATKKDAVRVDVKMTNCCITQNQEVHRKDGAADAVTLASLFATINDCHNHMLCQSSLETASSLSTSNHRARPL